MADWIQFGKINNYVSNSSAYLSNREVLTSLTVKINSPRDEKVSKWKLFENFEKLEWATLSTWEIWITTESLMKLILFPKCLFEIK